MDIFSRKNYSVSSKYEELKDIVLSSDYENLKYLKKIFKTDNFKRPSKYARSQTKMKSL